MRDEIVRKCRLFATLLIAVVAFLAAAAPVHAAQQSNFTVGTAAGTELPNCTNDPRGVAGTCWGLNISCPNVNAFRPYDATLKITTPTGASIGTVIFIDERQCVRHPDEGPRSLITTGSLWPSAR